MAASAAEHEQVRFQGGAGRELAGVVEHPRGDTHGWSIFAHCFTCSKDLRVVREIAGRLTAAGIGVLRFDFTGLGHSEGELAETTFTTNLADLTAASEFLAANHAAPGLLIGHSLGGAAVLACAADLPDTKAIATIGAPHEPSHVQHLVESAQFDERGRAPVNIGGRPFEIGREFVEDLGRHDPDERIATLSRRGIALMIFHSPIDQVVGIENAERIYTAAKHPKSFVSLREADHLLSKPADARFCGDVLAAWALHQLG